MNESVVLESINVRKTFIQGGRSIEVLTGLNLTLKNKDRVAIVGRSGCGKSTLLHVLAGLDEADSGLINVIGSDLTKASSDQRAQLRLRGMGFCTAFSCPRTRGAASTSSAGCRRSTTRQRSRV